VRKRDRGKRERVPCECYTLFSSCSRPLMICVSPIIRKIFSLFKDIEEIIIYLESPFSY
jgi:hypothetical protein